VDELQLQLARNVLPRPPADLRGWGISGGSLRVTLESATERSTISARMASVDVQEHMHLVLPVNHPDGGGFDVICEVADHFFRNGTDVTVELSVLRVERRKPFRSRPRAAINELCLLRLMSRHAEPVQLEGKLVDVSAAGVGVITDRSFELEPGDRLEMASQIGPDVLHCTLIALHTQPASFGRHRTGCRIDATDEAGRRIIDQLLRAHGRLHGDPSHRRTRIPRAA
jgi:hypothetical protein